MSEIITVSGGRATGKSHYLVEWLLKSPESRFILVPHRGYQEQCHFLLRKLSGGPMYQDHVVRVGGPDSQLQGHGTGCEVALDGVSLDHPHLTHLSPLIAIAMVTRETDSTDLVISVPAKSKK